MSSRAVYQTTETEVRTQRYIYTWSIKKFSLLSQDTGEKICSSWFHQKNDPPLFPDKWRFELYPRGQSKNFPENSNYISLYLARESSGKSSISIHFEMKISKSGKVLKQETSTDTYKPQGIWGYDRFLERSKLIDENSSDDHITITCIIDLPTEVSSTTSFDTPIFDPKESQLSDDFRSLFEDPIFSDFTIIAGNEKFPTHRSILAKRSSVFAAMFEHKDLEENRKKEMKIENIEPDVIKGMLEFIYTHRVTNMKELASGLLEAADKYDLEKLRIMCEKILYEGLNKENAVDILMLADFHHADTLRKYVMKYIVDYAPELVKSDNWKKIGDNPELLLEFVDDFFKSLTANNEES